MNNTESFTQYGVQFVHWLEPTKEDYTLIKVLKRTGQSLASHALLLGGAVETFSRSLIASAVKIAQIALPCGLFKGDPFQGVSRSADATRRAYALLYSLYKNHLVLTGGTSATALAVTTASYLPFYLLSGGVVLQLLLSPFLASPNLPFRFPLPPQPIDEGYKQASKAFLNLESPVSTDAIREYGRFLSSDGTVTFYSGALEGSQEALPSDLKDTDLLYIPFQLQTDTDWESVPDAVPSEYGLVVVDPRQKSLEYYTTDGMNLDLPPHLEAFVKRLEGFSEWHHEAKGVKVQDSGAFISCIMRERLGKGFQEIFEEDSFDLEQKRISIGYALAPPETLDGVKSKEGVYRFLEHLYRQETLEEEKPRELQDIQKQITRDLGGQGGNSCRFRIDEETFTHENSDELYEKKLSLNILELLHQGAFGVPLMQLYQDLGILGMSSSFSLTNDHDDLKKKAESDENFFVIEYRVNRQKREPIVTATCHYVLHAHNQDHLHREEPYGVIKMQIHADFNKKEDPLSYCYWAEEIIRTEDAQESHRR